MKLHGLLLLACLTPALNATPLIGILNYTGELRVSTVGGVTTIDFLPSVVITGDVLAGQFSNTGDFSGFNGLTSTQRAGNTVDISSATTFPIANFLDFNNSGIVTLDTMVLSLVGLAPSAAQVGCPAGLAVNESCQPVAGSVFTLTRDATGTSARISGLVTVTQGGDTVNGTLNLTAQFLETPDVIAAAGFTASGTPLTTFSASVNTTGAEIPEPGTYVLSMLGIAGLFAARRFQRN